MTFTVDKMYRLPDAGALKAFVDISIDDVLIIKGLRVVEGKRGLFVTLPQELGKNSKWYDVVVCKSAQVYEDIVSAVLEHYKHSGERGVNL